MSKEVKNEIVDVEATEVVENENSNGETKKSKVKAVVKKHGKKIVSGIALLTAGAIGFALGHRGSGENGNIDVDDVDDSIIGDNDIEL